MKWSDGAWRFSCKKFAVRVMIINNIITEAAPVTRSFIGQPPDNLRGWFQKFGGFRLRRLR